MKAKFTINSDEAGLVTCEIEDMDGAVVKKKVKLEDYCSMIYDSSEKLTQSQWQYCFNPPDTFSHMAGIRGLVMGAYSNSSMRAVFFIPADRQAMNYVGTSYVIPFPSLIFYFETQKEKLTDTRVYAVKIRHCGELGTDTRLYAFPFGNVEAESGHVCWGNTTFTSIHQFPDFHRVISSFFGSEVNDDYYHAGHHVTDMEMFRMQRGLLNHLAGLDGGFPEEYLVGSGMGTFEALEQRFIF